MNQFNLRDPSTHWSTLTDEQRKKFTQQHDHWKHYNGQYKEHLAPKTLPNGSLIDDNVKINLAKRVVEKGNNFLFGKGIEWQLDDNQKSTAIENVLYEAWGNSESINAFLPEVGLNGGVTGDYYIQLVYKDETVKVKNLNPAYVFPTLNPDNDDEAESYDMRFYRNERWHRIIHAPFNDVWEFYTEVWDRGKWNSLDNNTIWPYSWPFIIHGKNLPNPNNYYGQSDLSDISLNDPINQVASNLNRIIRIFAHPIVWGSGLGSQQLDLRTDQVITSTNDKMQLGALELARDLTSAQEYLKFLRTMYAEITSVPEADPERLGIGAQSGFALQVLFNDLILKTGIKQALYGKTFIELNRRILEVKGLGPDNQIKIHWPNALPLDTEAQTSSDEFDLAAKLASAKTISVKRGYDYVIEQEQLKNERVSTTSIGEEIVRAFSRGN